MEIDGAESNANGRQLQWQWPNLVWRLLTKPMWMHAIATKPIRCNYTKEAGSLQTAKARRVTISPIGELRDPGFKE
jgi:hypothetical protein